MSDERKIPVGEEQWVRPQEPATPPEPAEPATTGDMQEVGATAPEEVAERQEESDGAAPVHENPGDQNSG